MVTIKEIARKAGYSPTTVSRLLNGDPRLSLPRSTQQKIIKVSEELGYVARNKRVTWPRDIAILDTSSSAETLEDSYFDALKETAATVMKKYRMWSTVFTRVDDLIADGSDLDGFISIGAANFNGDELNALHEGIPYGVFLDTNPAPTLFDSAQPDFNQIILDALDQFQAAGMKRIGFIGGIGRIMGFHEYPEDPRSLAFRNWTNRLGIDTDRDGLIYASGPFSTSNGRALGEKVVADLRGSLPDAFIVAADTLAVGVLQAFASAGILVPRDVSLVSINDLPIAQYTSPALSSYSIDQTELVETAVSLLADGLMRHREVKQHVYQTATLRVRESFTPMAKR